MRLTTNLFVAFVMLGLGVARAETLQLDTYWAQEPRLLLAPVTIDGTPTRLLFDTGAGLTGLAPSAAQRAGCTPFGRYSGFRMRGDRLDTGKCGRRTVRVGEHISQLELGAVDFRALLPPEAPPLDGIMGVDVFADRLVTIDIAGRMIHLDQRPGRGWREGEVRFARELGGASLTPFVRVEAPTGELWMLLDSGHLGPVYLSPGALEQLGAPTLDQPIALNVSGAGAHTQRAALVETLLYDGVLGEPFMRQFEVAIDFRSERIWWRTRSD